MRNGHVLTAAGCLALAMGVAAAAQDSGSFHVRFAVNGPVTLDIDSGSGAIQVTGAPGSAVTVDATVHQGWSLFGGNDPRAVQAVENHPPVEQNGNHVILQQPGGWNNNISISYTVTTPPDTSLHARTGSGRIEVHGLRGTADVGTGSGGIRAYDIGGDLRASTGSGGIQFERVGGSARLTAGSGSIEGDSLGGRISATTGSGHIEIRDLAQGGELHTASGGMELEQVGGDLTAHSGSGSIRVDGQLQPNRHWELSAASGGIELGLPPTTYAEAHLQTASGGIQINLGARSQSSWSRHDWDGTLGNGTGSPTALLSAHTGSGSIRVN